jgi:DAPG hydrolase PhiG domain
MKYKIPEARTFNWQMKTTESAVTSLTTDKFGVLHMYIEHDVIKGVTPKMLEWWFKNIGGNMEYEGKTYPKYLVWHPFDHIHWSLANQLPGNAAGVGSKFHIVEAFGADRRSTKVR